MSRLSESVPLSLIHNAGIVIPSGVKWDVGCVEVAYGYDYPLHNYFIQIWFDEDEPVGFDYGGVGVGKQIGRWEMHEIADKCGLAKLATAISWDLPV